MADKKTDKTLPLLALLAGLGRPAGTDGQGGLGLRVVTVKTTEPSPLTFVMEGTAEALDPELFEIPVDCYPLRVGDQLLAFPLVSQATADRWGLIQKINGGLVMATMKGPTSCQPDGMDVTYGADRLIIPPVVQVKEALNIPGDWDESRTNPEKAPLKPQQAVYAPYTEKELNWIIRPLKEGDRVSLGPSWDGSQVKYVILQRY